MGDNRKIMQVRSARQVPVRVLLLDDELFDEGVDKRAVGWVLFDKVCEELNLLEKDYFGLSYKDATGLKYWLNNDKKISKQMKGQNWDFTFEVKFYPNKPSQLTEDITRYQLCLQIRRDIVNEKLPGSFLTYTLLGSYTAQSELGDYDTEEFGSGYKYLKDIKFAPHQDKELLQKIAELHRQHKGQTPEEAELHFLENAVRLSMYGVELHAAKDAEGKDISLGVCADGLIVYKDNVQMNRFVWPKVLKISYRRHKYYIKIRPGEFEEFASLIGFKLLNVKMAKRLWKISIEHHSFFRFREPDEPKSVGLVPRFGSRFRYSGRTQFQTRQFAAAENRDAPAFDRVMSKRGTFGGRTQNMRRRDEERQQRRDELRKQPIITDNRPPPVATKPPMEHKPSPPEPNYPPPELKTAPVKAAPPIAPKPGKPKASPRGPPSENTSLDRSFDRSFDSFDDAVPDRRSKMEKMHAVPTPLAAVMQKSFEEREAEENKRNQRDHHHDPHERERDIDRERERDRYHQVGNVDEPVRGRRYRSNNENTNTLSGKRNKVQSAYEFHRHFEPNCAQPSTTKQRSGRRPHSADTNRNRNKYLFSYPASSVDSILSNDYDEYDGEKPVDYDRTRSVDGLHREPAYKADLSLRHSLENISSGSDQSTQPHKPEQIYAEINELKTESKQLVKDIERNSKIEKNDSDVEEREGTFKRVRSKIFSKKKKTQSSISKENKSKEAPLELKPDKINHEQMNKSPKYAKINKNIKDKPPSLQTTNTQNPEFRTPDFNVENACSLDGSTSSSLKEELKMYILNPERMNSRSDSMSESNEDKSNILTSESQASITHEDNKSNIVDMDSNITTLTHREHAHDGKNDSIKPPKTSIDSNVELNDKPKYSDRTCDQEEVGNLMYDDLTSKPRKVSETFDSKPNEDTEPSEHGYQSYSVSGNAEDKENRHLDVGSSVKVSRSEQYDENNPDLETDTSQLLDSNRSNNSCENSRSECKKVPSAYVSHRHLEPPCTHPADSDNCNMFNKDVSLTEDNGISGVQIEYFDCQDDSNRFKHHVYENLPEKRDEKNHSDTSSGSFESLEDQVNESMEIKFGKVVVDVKGEISELCNLSSESITTNDIADAKVSEQSLNTEQQNKEGMKGAGSSSSLYQLVFDGSSIGSPEDTIDVSDSFTTQDCDHVLVNPNMDLNDQMNTFEHFPVSEHTEALTECDGNTNKDLSERALETISDELPSENTNFNDSSFTAPVGNQINQDSINDDNKESYSPTFRQIKPQLNPTVKSKYETNVDSFEIESYEAEPFKKRNQSNSLSRRNTDKQEKALRDVPDIEGNPSVGVEPLNQASRHKQTGKEVVSDKNESPLHKSQLLDNLDGTKNVNVTPLVIVVKTLFPDDDIEANQDIDRANESQNSKDDDMSGDDITNTSDKIQISNPHHKRYSPDPYWYKTHLLPLVKSTQFNKSESDSSESQEKDRSSKNSSQASKAAVAVAASYSPKRKKNMDQSGLRKALSSSPIPTYPYSKESENRESDSALNDDINRSGLRRPMSSSPIPAYPSSKESEGKESKTITSKSSQPTAPLIKDSKVFNLLHSFHAPLVHGKNAKGKAPQSKSLVSEQANDKDITHGEENDPNKILSGNLKTGKKSDPYQPYKSVYSNLSSISKSKLSTSSDWSESGSDTESPRRKGGLKKQKISPGVIHIINPCPSGWMAGGLEMKKDDLKNKNADKQRQTVEKSNPLFSDNIKVENIEKISCLDFHNISEDGSQPLDEDVALDRSNDSLLSSDNVQITSQQVSPESPAKETNPTELEYVENRLSSFPQVELLSRRVLTHTYRSVKDVKPIVKVKDNEKSDKDDEDLEKTDSKDIDKPDDDCKRSVTVCNYNESNTQPNQQCDNKDKRDCLSDKNEPLDEGKKVTNASKSFSDENKLYNESEKSEPIDICKTVTHASEKHTQPFCNQPKNVSNEHFVSPLERVESKINDQEDEIRSAKEDQEEKPGRKELDVDKKASICDDNNLENANSKTNTVAMSSSSFADYERDLKFIDSDDEYNETNIETEISTNVSMIDNDVISSAHIDNNVSLFSFKKRDQGRNSSENKSKQSGQEQGDFDTGLQKADASSTNCIEMETNEVVDKVDVGSMTCKSVIKSSDNRKPPDSNDSSADSNRDKFQHCSNTNDNTQHIDCTGDNNQHSDSATCDDTNNSNNTRDNTQPHDSVTENNKHSGSTGNNFKHHSSTTVDSLCTKHIEKDDYDGAIKIAQKNIWPDYQISSDKKYSKETDKSSSDSSDSDSSATHTDSDSSQEIELASFEMPTHQTDISVHQHTSSYRQFNNQPFPGFDTGSSIFEQNRNVFTQSSEVEVTAFAIDCSFEDVESYGIVKQKSEFTDEPTTPLLCECNFGKNIWQNTQKLNRQQNRSYEETYDNDFFFNTDTDLNTLRVPEVIDDTPFKPVRSNLKCKFKSESSLFDKRVTFQENLPVYKSSENIRCVGQGKTYSGIKPEDCEAKKLEYMQKFIQCLFENEPRNIGLPWKGSMLEPTPSLDDGFDVESEELKQQTNKQPSDSKDRSTEIELSISESGLQKPDQQCIESPLYPEPFKDNKISDNTKEKDNSNAQLPIKLDSHVPRYITFESDDEKNTQPKPTRVVQDQMPPFTSERQQLSLDLPVIKHSPQIVKPVMRRRQHDSLQEPCDRREEFLVLERETLSKDEVSDYTDTGLAEIVPKRQHSVENQEHLDHISNVLSSMSESDNKYKGRKRSLKHESSCEAQLSDDLKNQKSSEKKDVSNDTFQAGTSIDSVAAPLKKEFDAETKPSLNTGIARASEEKQARIKPSLDTSIARVNEDYQANTDNDAVKTDIKQISSSTPSFPTDGKITKYTCTYMDESDPDSPKIKSVTYEYVTEYKLNNVKVSYQHNQKVQTESDESVKHKKESETDSNVKENRKKSWKTTTGVQVGSFSNSTEHKFDIGPTLFDVRPISYRCNRQSNIGSDGKESSEIPVEEFIDKSVCYPLGSVMNKPITNTEDPSQHAEESFTRNVSHTIHRVGNDSERSKYDTDLKDRLKKQNQDRDAVKEYSNLKTTFHRNSDSESESNLRRRHFVTNIGRGYTNRKVIEHNSKRFVLQTFEREPSNSIIKKRSDFALANTERESKKHWTLLDEVDGDCEFEEYKRKSPVDHNSDTDEKTVDDSSNLDDTNEDGNNGSVYSRVMAEKLPDLHVAESTNDTIFVVQAMAVLALGTVLIFLLPFAG